jgi:broad specificity phosphatase PhoE
MRNASGALALVVTILFVGCASAQRAPSVESLLQQLRAGGHVIVLRHGATRADQSDTDPLNTGNVDRQRRLNPKGRADAAAAGAVLKAAGVPIGTVYSSRFYRAIETARLIGGKEPITTADVSEGGDVVTPDENNRRAQALRTMAATLPDPGTNTLIVSHKPNVIDAFGRDWLEVKEGEATIFKPDGAGTYTLVGRLQMNEWKAAK